MKQGFILYQRSGTFYCEDTQTRKQQSLRTKDEAEAKALLHSKNEAFRQPLLNQQIALAYLSATDSEAAERTWQFVMDEMTATKRGDTHARHVTAMKDKAFDLIRAMPLLETQAEHLLKVLRTGTVATNVYLRRLHNFALDMNWQPKGGIPTLCGLDAVARSSEKREQGCRCGHQCQSGRKQRRFWPAELNP